MLVVEAKLKNGTPEQYQKLDETIRTSQFVRNSCIRYWIENKGTTRNDLQKLCAVLAKNKETSVGWIEATKSNTIITLKIYIHMGKGFNSSSVKASFNHPMLTGTSYNLPVPKRFHI